MAWLSLFLFLLMCGIVFYQSTHGTFSALIMAVLSIFCATVALGMHEMIATEYLYDLLGDYSYPVALIATFAVLLILLRVAADKVISRSTLLPNLVDRLGGVGFGLITGLVTCGMLGLSVQMIPWGSSILGFERIKEDGKESGLWLHPDKFTIAMCTYLNEASLGSSAESWMNKHPDFAKELFWVNSRPSLGSRITAAPNSVKVERIATTKQIYNYVKPVRRRQKASYDLVSGPPAGKRWLVVSTVVDSDNKDRDNTIRASQTQVRLVGESGGRTEQHTLTAIGPEGGPHITFKNLDQFGAKDGNIDCVFEVSEDFKPRFVEFKRGGYASLQGALANISQMSAKAPPKTSPKLTSTTGNKKTVPVRPKYAGSHFGYKLPYPLKRYSATDLDIGSSGLSSGHIVAFVDEQLDDNKSSYQMSEKTTITSLAPFSGLPVLQLNVEALHASTTPGGLMNLTRRVLRQYRVIDKQGVSYFASGLIAECQSNGQRVVEVQYFPEFAEHGPVIRKFDRIHHSDLTGDYQFYLLFALPSGTEVVTFDAGRSKTDLSDLNLVAP